MAPVLASFHAAVPTHLAICHQNGTSNNKLEVSHLEVWGPAPTHTNKGMRYLPGKGGQWKRST